MHHLSSKSFLIVSIVGIIATVMWFFQSHQSQAAGNATTYWVAQSGGNTGTCGTAQGASDPGIYLRTVTAGIGCLSAGDTLLIKNGTYAETISGFLMSMPNGTSWSIPITVKNAPGHAPLMRASNAPHGIWQFVNSQYWVLDGLILEGDGEAYSGGVYHAVKIDEGAHHIRIKNCTFRDVYVAITENGGTSAGYEAFTEVLNNYFTRVGGEGFYMHSRQHGPTGGKLRSHLISFISLRNKDGMPLICAYVASYPRRGKFPTSV